MGCNDCGLSAESNREYCEPCAGLRTENIHVTPLTRDDLELVLAWRSNIEIYQYFREQDGPLRWNKHIEWFESREPRRYDFVIRFESRRVGIVSLDAENEVGIYLGDFSAQGEGVATASLGWLCTRFEDRAPLNAEIHRDNDASQRLFERCGFNRQATEDEWLRYEYKS